MVSVMLLSDAFMFVHVCILQTLLLAATILSTDLLLMFSPIPLFSKVVVSTVKTIPTLKGKKKQ